MVMESPPRATAPTVSDVARSAGVSTATVSRVLNTPDVVAEPTRDRVLAAIDALEYRPNVAARRLAGGVTATLGLLMHELASPYFAELLAGIEAVARETGYHLLIAATETDRRRGAVLPPVDGLVEGLIVTPDAVGDARIRALARQRRPLVLLERTVPGVRSIGFANEQGAMAAVDHLVSVHHVRSIARLAGPIGSSASQEREAGWARALALAGLEADPTTLERGGWAEEDGEAAVHRLLGTGVTFDAIVAGNDEMAIGAMRALVRAGRQVPDTVRVVGFDDIGPARWVRPALTTVDGSPRTLGAAAARALITIARGGIGEVETRLPTSLVVRASCGCHWQEE